MEALSIFSFCYTEKEVEEKIEEIAALKKLLSAQTMSVEEREDIKKRCEFQEKQNKLLEKELEDYISMLAKAEANLLEEQNKVIITQYLY